MALIALTPAVSYKDTAWVMSWCFGRQRDKGDRGTKVTEGHLYTSQLQFCDEKHSWCLFLASPADWDSCAKATSCAVGPAASVGSPGPA